MQQPARFRSDLHTPPSWTVSSAKYSALILLILILTVLLILVLIVLLILVILLILVLIVLIVLLILIVLHFNLRSPPKKNLATVIGGIRTAFVPSIIYIPYYISYCRK